MYICRVCLGQDRPLYVPLFSLQGERTVAKTIMLCTGLQLEKDDGLTQFACGQCTDDFAKFFKLRELCLESDAFLRESYHHPCDKDENSEHIIKESNSATDVVQLQENERFDKSIVIEEIRLSDVSGESKVIREEWVVEMDADVSDGNDNFEDIEVLEDHDNSSQDESIPLPTGSKKSDKSLKQKKSRRKTKSQSPTMDPTKFICCSCPSEVFDSQQQLEAHRTEQHEKYRVKASTIRPFECDVCYQRFLNKTHLEQHKNRPYRKRRFVCTSCGAAFLASSTLKKHEETCTVTVPNYVCNECGKRFLQSGSLRNHMKLHTSDKTHSCPICGKTFMKRFEVPIHLVTHTTEQPFACDKCPARFKRMQAMRNHQRHHSNPNPYKCDQCDEWFNSFSARKYHRQKVHEGIEPFRCQKCGASYGRQSRLTHHIRKAHPDGVGT